MLNHTLGGGNLEAIIQVKNLTYNYQLSGTETIRALEDLSLEIEEGSYVALVGPNGSGKSTLARHFNALLMPTSGEVIVDGFSTSEERHRWEIRRRVGMVFQNPDNQIVATTVEEDVAFGLENLGMAPELIRRRVDETLDRIGLSSYAKQSPHLLSGGQKQRLSIAGIIAMRPRCLVLDEPTAMLDPRGRMEVLNTVKQLNNREKITVVHITHSMEEALEADQVVILAAGKIIRIGQPKEIFSGELDLGDLGLEVPTVPRLAHILRQGGIEISYGVLRMEQLVNVLC